MGESWRYSFIVSVSPTSFKAVGNGDWKKLIEFISLSGYEGVELALRDPDSINFGQLKSILKENKLQLAAIGTGQVYLEERLSLSTANENIRLKAIARLKGHINLAGICGGYIIIGLIRAELRNEALNDNDKFSYFRSSIFELSDYARTKNICLLIEPLNRYECGLLNQLDEVIKFIEEIKCPNVAVLLDTFHMNIEEKDIYQAIIKAGPLLKHMHIADSNRRYPGQGHLGFAVVGAALRKINYQGFVSGEILPFPDLETAIKEYIKKTKEMLNG